MRSVSKSLPGHPTLSSHSFQIGYLTQLWRDTDDIKFVKQSIEHRKMDITSFYVEKLSNQKRQEHTF